MTEPLPPGIRTETAYVARDDSRHRYLDDAVRRNQNLDEIDAANALLEAGAALYDAVKAWGRSEPPDVLRQINKDTPLIISHWQCSDDPAYKVCKFDLRGIWVWGDPGKWSGPYGNFVSVRDLERYVETTLKKHPCLALSHLSHVRTTD